MTITIEWDAEQMVWFVCRGRDRIPVTLTDINRAIEKS